MSFVFLIFLFRGLVSNKSELEEVAELPVKLVPIRIEFDIDNFHLSDTFMWNLNGGLAPWC